MASATSFSGALDAVETPIHAAAMATHAASSKLSPGLKDKPALYGWKTTNEQGYTIDEKLSGSTQPLKVIGVGAGASGINLAKSVRDDLENVECVIYEKNEA